MAIMSMRAYARHRDVALSAVQKAIKAGRIAKLPNGQIDSDAADVSWKRNTRTYAPAVTRQPAQVEEDSGGVGAGQYHKARTIREHYNARMAKVDYEERVGQLISVDEVKITAFNKFRQFRDNMLNIAERIAAMIAAESEAAKCHGILTEEIRRALNDFADANS